MSQENLTITRHPDLLGEREPKPKIVFQQEQNTVKRELLRYMILRDMWPSKETKEDVMKKICLNMGFVYDNLMEKSDNVSKIIHIIMICKKYFIYNFFCRYFHGLPK